MPAVRARPSRQELGLLLLIKRNVRVLTANGDDLTDTNDPSRVMMRQIAGSFAQYEKTRLVTKLRGARETHPRGCRQMRRPQVLRRARS
jgi:DNA invertase Pin-like site-specific DNA recombinase